MKVLSNLSLYGTLGLNSVADANTDTDKFLVIDSNGIVKYRTGQELYNDIGAGGAASYTSTLQHEVKAGVALTKGQAVYVTSADGTNMIVSKASNASEATSSKTLGLIAQDLSINGKGFVITEGLLSGLNTMAAGTEGDPVWLGTDGNLIYGLGSKPYAPAHLVFIGIVTRKNANNGEIFVKVQNGFELQELHNVQITSTPSDNTVLAYETATSLYKMKSIPTLLGYTPTTNARTLTINGTSYDLSADRSWSVGTHTGNLTTGYVPKATGATTLTDSLIYDNGSAIGINTSSPFESSNFKLDVNGGVIIKNTSGTLAQLILINSNPATGGNNGFVQFTAGGNTATAFAELQSYYGLSIASGALRLQPSGGQVLIGTSTTSAFTTDINGTLRVSGQLTLGSTITNGTYTYTLPSATGTLALASSLSSYVPTSRTLTINGTTFDLSADRSWTIAAGVSSILAGTGISVSNSSGTVTVSNTGLLSGTAGSGISVSTSGQNLNIVNTGLLSGTAGSGISVSTSGQNLNIVNTGLLSATAGSGISVSTSSQNVNIVNTGLLSATAGTGISVSTSSGVLTVTNTITNNNQLTNGAGYITGINSSMVTTALGYTPVTDARTLTINGVTYDLTANRSWTVGNVTGSGTTNYLTKFTGSSTIGNSLIRDDGSNVAVAAAPISQAKLYVVGNFGINYGNFRLGNETAADNEAFEFYKSTNILRVYRNGGAFGGTYSASDVNFDLYDGTEYNVRISGAGNSYLKTLSVGTTTGPSLGNSVRMANGFQAYITSGGYPDRSYIIDTDGTGQLDFVSYPVSGNAYGNSIGIFKPPNISSKDLLLMSGNANIRFVTGGYTEVMRVNNNTTVSMYGGLFGTSAEFSGTVYAGNVVTIERSAASSPATSGTSQSSGHRIRLTTTGVATAAIDFGTAGATGGWIQATNKADLSLTYPLLLNPNGGNVGISGSLSSWSLGTVLQINGSNAAINFNGTSAIFGIVNAYYNGSSYIYQNTGTTASYEYGLARSNAFNWRVSGNATAGSTAVLPIVMSLSSSGNLSIGNQNDNYRLEVTGTSYFSTDMIINRDVNVTGQGRFKGWYTTGTGLAAEIGVSSSVANIISYDRTAGRYYPLSLSGGDGAGNAQTTIYITTEGVGIGTQTINQAFVVSKGSDARIQVDSSSTQGFYFTKSGANNGTFRVNASGDFEFYTKSVAQAFVLAVGGTSTFANSVTLSSGTLFAPKININAGTTAEFSFAINQQSTFAFGSTNGRRIAYIANGAVDDSGLQFGYDATDKTGIIAGSATSAGAGIDFYTFNGSTWGNRVRISKDGTTSFSSSVTATNAILSGGSTPNLFIQSANGGTSVQFRATANESSQQVNLVAESNHALTFWTNSTERMRLNQYGQLLINATSSAYSANLFGYNLGVRGTNNQTFISIARANQTLDSQGMIVGLDTTTAYMFVHDNIPLSFSNNGTEKMRIQPNGNVHIGAGVPSSTALFTVSGTAHFSGGNSSGATFNIIPATTGQNGVNLLASYWTGTGFPYLNFEVGGNNAFRITPSKEFYYYAEDNSVARANIYYQLANNEYRIYATNGSGTTTGVKIMEYNGTQYYQVLTTNTGLRLTGGTLSGTLSVNAELINYVAIGPNDNVRTGLLTYDTTAQAEGVGGQLVLGYKYTDAGDYTQGAIIKMYKENSASGQFGSGLKFQVRNHGDNLSTKMTLNPSGNLGINITNPSSKLHIVGSTDIINATSTTTNARINIGHSGNGGYVGYANLGAGDASNTFYVTNGSGVIGNGITMNNAGRVSIGTAAVDAGKQLYLTGAFRANITSDGGNATDRCTIYDTNGSQIDLVSYGAGGSAYNGSMGMFVNGGKDALIMAGNANIRFVTGGYTEIMRVTNGGAVFINTQSSILSGAALHVNGTAAFGQLYAGNLSTGALYSNGGYLTNTNPSDYRLKNTIKPLTYGLNEILKLNPKTFYYNDDITKARLKYGFIAQEVKEIMPELARKLEGSSDYLGLETEGIFVTLVNAVKELKAELDSIKNNQNII